MLKTSHQSHPYFPLSLYNFPLVPSKFPYHATSSHLSHPYSHITLHLPTCPDHTFTLQLNSHSQLLPSRHSPPLFLPLHSHFPPSLLHLTPMVLPISHNSHSHWPATQLDETCGYAGGLEWMKVVVWMWEWIDMAMSNHKVTNGRNETHTLSVAFLYSPQNSRLTPLRVKKSERYLPLGWRLWQPCTWQVHNELSLWGQV
jgi:hypothetical protein